MYCTRCGNEMDVGDNFCQKCGQAVVKKEIKEVEKEEMFPKEVNKIEVETHSETTDQLEEKLLYVGDNKTFYEKKWRKSQTPKKAVSWNWPAFLFMPYWLGYRKMYTYLLIVSIINFLSGLIFGVIINVSFIILLSVAVGIFGNALYFSQAEKDIQKIKESEGDAEEQRRLIVEKGGVGWKGIAIAIGVNVILGIIVSIL